MQSTFNVGLNVGLKMATIKDTKAKSIKPTDKALAHGGVEGLWLLPSKTAGRGKWILRFVSPTTGKRRDMGFGVYPDKSIADVGDLAKDARKLIAQGIDPLEHRQQSEQTKKSMPTFEEAARLLHADLMPSWKNAKHSAQWLNTLKDFAFPFIGNRRINEITPALIADVLRPIWIEKAETASRVKQRLHAVMAWAWAHGHCAANPVDVVVHLLPKQEGKATRTEHFPAMPWRMIPAFVATSLKPGPRYDTTRPLLEFLILTACRSGEARGMTWDEIVQIQIETDNGVITIPTWVIPAERMKMKQAHYIPLSDRALEILESQRGLHESLVFPAPRGGELSDMVLTTFLRRQNAISGTANRVATAHGFRSSFRDWAEDNKYADNLAEKALAHSIANQTKAAYLRTLLLEMRQPMMQAWSDMVTSKNSTQIDRTPALKQN